MGVSLIAGGGAANKSVLWAHVCELPEPWEWLGQGDLLMTIGLGIPADESGQIEWVRSCAAAGLVAVAIGDSAYAPPLMSKMLRCADEVGLPFLLTQWSFPNVSIARTVASANRDEERERLAKAQRIYELFPKVGHDSDLESLLRVLSAELGVDLAVVESPSAHVVTATSIHPDVVRAVTRELQAISEGLQPSRFGFGISRELPP